MNVRPNPRVGSDPSRGIVSSPVRIYTGVPGAQVRARGVCVQPGTRARDSEEGVRDVTEVAAMPDKGQRKISRTRSQPGTGLEA